MVRPTEKRSGSEILRLGEVDGDVHVAVFAGGVKLTGLDTANWVYNSQDGYYYYRKKISEGEKTTPLCTGFQIDPQKIDDTYGDSIKDFEINVYEEAVQAEGFSDYESAWRYFSDPVSAQAERRGNA